MCVQPAAFTLATASYNPDINRVRRRNVISFCVAGALAPVSSRKGHSCGTRDAGAAVIHIQNGTTPCAFCRSQIDRCKMATMP
jgi:hypothetical protein